MNILGINAYHGNASAAIVCDGRLIAAVEGERFKVLAKFTGIPEALASAFDADPKKLGAKFHRIEHHRAHLASSFFVSPFERAALLSADGLGDFASTMWGAGAGGRL